MQKKYNYNTDEELCKVLGVKSINDISEKNIEAIFSKLPQINPDVLDKVIKVLPDSAEAVDKIEKAIAHFYEEDYKAAESQNDTIKAYMDMLEFLRREATKKNISSTEKDKIKSEMQDIILKIAQEEIRKEEERREIRNQKTKTVFIIIGLVIIVAGLVTVFALVPGFVAETLVIISGILAFVGIMVFYNIKKKEIKLKYKNMR
jgi:hypothetical protein